MNLKSLGQGSHFELKGFRVSQLYDSTVHQTYFKIRGRFKSVTLAVSDEALQNMPSAYITDAIEAAIVEHKLVPFDNAAHAAMKVNGVAHAAIKAPALAGTHPVVQSLAAMFDMQQRELRSCCEPGVYTLAETVIHLNDTHKYSFEQIATWLESSNYDIAARPQEE